MKRLRRWVWGLLALSMVAVAQTDPALQLQAQVQSGTDAAGAGPVNLSLRMAADAARRIPAQFCP